VLICLSTKQMFWC